MNGPSVGCQRMTGHVEKGPGFPAKSQTTAGRQAVDCRTHVPSRAIQPLGELWVQAILTEPRPLTVDLQARITVVLSR